MANNYIPYNSTNSYQGTQYFPRPQGNVYMVNNSLEVGNIPMGGDISVILCPSEELMYMKGMQNGTPTMCVYKISPCEVKKPENQSDFIEIIKSLEERIISLENKLTQNKEKEKGGLNELL